MPLNVHDIFKAPEWNDVVDASQAMVVGLITYVLVYIVCAVAARYEDKHVGPEED